MESKTSIFAGKVMLIKSIISTISLYTYLSSKCLLVWGKLVENYREFLCGWDHEGRKIA